MPRSLARLSAAASSHRNLSSAVFITNIAESDFSVHTGASHGHFSPNRTKPRSRLRVPKGAKVLPPPPCPRGNLWHGHESQEDRQGAKASPRAKHVPVLRQAFQ